MGSRFTFTYLFILLSISVSSSVIQLHPVFCRIINSENENKVGNTDSAQDYITELASKLKNLSQDDFKKLADKYKLGDTDAAKNYVSQLASDFKNFNQNDLKKLASMAGIDTSTLDQSKVGSSSLDFSKANLKKLASLVGLDPSTIDPSKVDLSSLDFSKADWKNLDLLNLLNMDPQKVDLSKLNMKNIPHENFTKADFELFQKKLGELHEKFPSMMNLHKSLDLKNMTNTIDNFSHLINVELEPQEKEKIQSVMEKLKSFMRATGVNGERPKTMNRMAARHQNRAQEELFTQFKDLFRGDKDEDVEYKFDIVEDVIKHIKDNPSATPDELLSNTIKSLGLDGNLMDKINNFGWLQNIFGNTTGLGDFFNSTMEKLMNLTQAKPHDEEL